MPYTLVHPGFSAWIKNKWLPGLSWNGLIFGSLVPDFDILFRFTEARFHLISVGFFNICFLLLPATLIISIIFHSLVRNTLIDFLPEILKKKVISFTTFNYLHFLKQHYGVEVVSILIAILLHYFLDLISHWNAWYFMMGFHVLIYPIPFLKPYFFYFGWYFPQIIATAFGVYFVYIYYFNPHFSIVQLKQITSNCPLKIKLFLLLFLLNAIAFAAVKLILFGFGSDGLAWHYVIIQGTGGLIYSFFITPLIIGGAIKIKSYFIAQKVA